MHPYKHFSFLLLCFLLSTLLCACGSRGDLYQAEDAQKAQKTAAKESQPIIKEQKKKPQ
jgi:predicted small lipoprotein YifL